MAFSKFDHHPTRFYIIIIIGWMTGTRHTARGKLHMKIFKWKQNTIFFENRSLRQKYSTFEKVSFSITVCLALFHYLLIILNNL